MAAYCKASHASEPERIGSLRLIYSLPSTVSSTHAPRTRDSLLRKWSNNVSLHLLRNIFSLLASAVYTVAFAFVADTKEVVLHFTIVTVRPSSRDGDRADLDLDSARLASIATKTARDTRSDHVTVFPLDPISTTD